MPIGGLGMGEIIMIFLVVLLLFGAKRLPEIGSALGKGIREFKSSVSHTSQCILLVHQPLQDSGASFSCLPEEYAQPVSLPDAL